MKMMTCFSVVGGVLGVPVELQRVPGAKRVLPPASGGPLLPLLALPDDVPELLVESDADPLVDVEPAPASRPRLVLPLVLPAPLLALPPPLLLDRVELLPLDPEELASPPPGLEPLLPQLIVSPSARPRSGRQP